MNRHAYAIFCDDVRHEIGNKTSYMGVYSEQLLVPQFPFLLPKLCVVTSVVTDLQEPFEELVVRLLKDDEVLAEVIVPNEKLENPLPLPIKNDADLAQVLKFQTVFVLSSLVIEQPCTLKIHVENEGEDFHSIGLRIHQLQAS